MAPEKWRRPPPRDAGYDLPDEQLAGGLKSLNIPSTILLQGKLLAALVVALDPAALVALITVVIGRRA